MKKHLATIKEVDYMVDQCFCSCGWESKVYFDGAEYAYQEFLKHKKLAMEEERIDAMWHV